MFTMKYMIPVLLAFCLFTSAQEIETEQEWKILANPADLSVEDAAKTFLKDVEAPPSVDAKEKAELARLKDLVSGERLELVPKDLLPLTKVRSIQIGRYGVFTYPYFKCRFKQTDRGLFFEKTTGSQRKSGLIFQNGESALVFLGTSTVNDDPQRPYSGLNRSKDTSHDSVGLIINCGKTYLGLFPRKNGAFEIYEFK